jgi:hypothetical protein
MSLFLLPCFCLIYYYYYYYLLIYCTENGYKNKTPPTTSKGLNYSVGIKFYKKQELT